MKTHNQSNSEIANAIKAVGVKYHDGELPSVADYKQGMLYGAAPDRHTSSWQELIYEQIVLNRRKP